MNDVVPNTAVIVPCRDEAELLGDLLDALVPQVAAQPGWRLVLVDDSSTDATGALLDDAAHGRPDVVTVRHGRWGSPGGARSAAVAIARHGHDVPDWTLTTDVDVTLPHDWISVWAATLADVDADPSVGAVNGEEAQAHLLEPFPVAARLSAAFGAVVGRAEPLVGITNLNGVNHAVRSTAYDTAGPYRQPTEPGPDGPIVLAGEDWDLGVRLRLAGYRITGTEAEVADRGRRLLGDLAAYLGGTAYEGEFRRLDPGPAATDLTEAQAAAMLPGTVRRALRHFYLKPLLALPDLLDGDVGLGSATVEAMRSWVRRWPEPTFTASRNGFLNGRLVRFADEFGDTVLHELGLRPW